MHCAEYLEHLRRDSAALLEAARHGPETPVPSCPEWDMAALVGHVGGVHRWVAGMLTNEATERGQFPDPPGSDDWDQFLEWYTEGANLLGAALAAVDPDELVWNWADRAPAPARFWHRRMAHETAVHRWDAQNAVGTPDPVEQGLAVDGVDEFLGFVDGWLRRRPVPELHGRLGLEATDAGATWELSLAPDQLEAARGTGHAHGVDAVVRTGASDLVLWLSGRLDPAAPNFIIGGDYELVAAWGRSVRF